MRQELTRRRSSAQQLMVKFRSFSEILKSFEKRCGLSIPIFEAWFGHASNPLETGWKTKSSRPSRNCANF